MTARASLSQVARLGGLLHAAVSLVLRAPSSARAPLSVVVCAAVAFSVFTSAALGGSQKPDELLPDLRAVPPYDLRVAGDSNRFVVGFGSTSQNVGTAHLKMRGHRDSMLTQRMSADAVR